MRAIGTSKFLKGRFGMGYLLRASLNSKAQPEQVHELISRFVPAAEVVSVAGTEFSIRLPKEASVVFASMFEAVDGQLQSLGIVNYGIETTTLEEVFIRIVNEDTDMLVRDHASANRMLGASADERDNFVEEIKRKDNKTHPLSEDTVKLLLTKGRQVETTELNTIHKQVNVLVWKRFFQLVRSKGQWMMNVIVPTCMIVISAIITYNIPTSILGDNPGATDTTYDSPFVTPVTGSSQAMATSSIEAAGVDNYVYVGVLGDQANLTMCFFFVACLIAAYVYSGNNFGLIFGIGLLFNITAIYRFYVFSSFLSDIRMAQTFYFYGSLLSMFVLILVYSLTVYTFLGGDASQGSAQTVAVICTVFDPSFGYLFLLMMQNDFLGVRTQNGDATIASTSVNGNLILTIFLCAFGYLLALVYIENGFGGVWSPRAKKQVDKEDVDHADPINPEEAFDNVLSVTEEGAVESGATPRVLTAKPHARSFGATDPDVELEKARVQEVYRSGSISKAHNAIFVHRLNRTYYGRGTRPTKVAVKDLSLSIELGEIFGL
ncbi:abcA2 [Symbiodinium microadriaticum]|nr:abcA2 [Symbiodinium microadriaticum]